MELNAHGTGLVLNGVGILLRGKSGAGKSLLALELIDDFKMRSMTALLVSDDRIDLAAKTNTLEMSAPDSIAGLIELRGRGIIKRDFVQTAPVNLIIDLVEEQVRFLEEDALITDLLGVSIDRCPVPHRGAIDSGHQRMLVKEAMYALDKSN